MEMQHNNHDYNTLDYIYFFFQFLVKNLLGVLSILFGVVTKVYIIRKEYKRIGKWQYRLSVIIAGLAGTIAYVVVKDLLISEKQKAIIVGFCGVLVEPVILRVLVWVNPIIDSIGNLFKKKIDKE